MNVNKGRGGALQDWSSRLGIGEQTGIDLPSEMEGIVPTPAWRNRLYRQKLTDRPWSAGDNINLAVGQGDVQANPLGVESVTGEALQEIEPPSKRTIEIPEEARSTVMGGLTRASMEEGGTSYPVFGNFPVDVAGKTGTAERGFTEGGFPLPDQAWFVALAPANDPEIVVAVTVERGGFGVDSAAPVAARMLEQYFKISSVPAVPAASRPETTE
jgi:penicillin-binding protein 2